jgi:hypothetical protein
MCNRRVVEKIERVWVNSQLAFLSEMSKINFLRPMMIEYFYGMNWLVC